MGHRTRRSDEKRVIVLVDVFRRENITTHPTAKTKHQCETVEGNQSMLFI